MEVKKVVQNLNLLKVKVERRKEVARSDEYLYECRGDEVESKE